MPYSRYRRYGRSGFRKSAAGYRNRFRSYRRPSRVTRFRAKKYVRRRQPTRRRILNVSTRKKNDTMLTGVGSTGEGVPQTQITINAAIGARYIIACMSHLLRLPGAEDHTRRHKDVYFVGWNDSYRLYVGGGAGWSWRRIVYSTVGRTLEAELPANLANGYMRQIQDVGVPTNPPADGFIEYLFSGTRQTDWVDVMTAPLDRGRVTVHSDVVRRLNPGNDSGKEVTVKAWTPVRKNLTYDDEEFASDVKPPTDPDVGSPWVVTRGNVLGNVYVVDFFDSMATDPAETLTVRIESKRYWHER